MSSDSRTLEDYKTPIKPKPAVASWETRPDLRDIDKKKSSTNVTIIFKSMCIYNLFPVHSHLSFFLYPLLGINPYLFSKIAE